MHSGIHVLQSLTLIPETEGRYTLEYRYRADGLLHRAYRVLVPPSLLRLLRAGEPAVVAVAELRRSGIASALADAFLVLQGVRLADGSIHVATPASFSFVKWAGSALAIAVAVGACFWALKTSSWMWLATGVAATHLVRSLVRVPGTAGLASALKED